MALSRHDGNSDPVTAAATRLRMVQADFADRPPEVRQQHVRDELERALNQLHPDDRAAFLEAIKERFPTWGPRVEISTPDRPEVAQTRTDARELRDWSFLVTRLGELLPQLTPEERKAVSRRLEELGLVERPKHGWSQQAAEEAAKRIKVPKAQDLDAVRVLELATLLAETILSLDKVMWPTWMQIAGRRSVIRRPRPLHQTIPRFAAGDEDVPRGQIQQDVESLRRLIASLVSSIGAAGPNFARSYHDRLSPENIEALAKGEKGRWEVLEAACWRKYRQLSSAQGPADIEAELMKQIARSTEELMGSGLPGGER